MSNQSVTKLPAEVSWYDIERGIDVTSESRGLTKISLSNHFEKWGNHPKKMKLLLAALIIVGIVGAIALGIHLGMGFDKFGNWFNQAALPWLKAHSLPLEMAAGIVGGGLILGGIAAAISIKACTKKKEKELYVDPFLD